MFQGRIPGVSLLVVGQVDIPSRELVVIVRGVIEPRGQVREIHRRIIHAGDVGGDIVDVMRPGGDPRNAPAHFGFRRSRAFSYRAPLPTTKDEWTEVAIPLEDFIPTAFGRRVQGMGPVEPSQINGLGFMLSDKKPGPFTMQVEWVKMLRAGE